MTDETAMTTTTAIADIADDVADFTVVATNPSEMERGQKQLIIWAARKIQAEKELMSEAQEQFDIAKKNKWGVGGWARRIKLSEDKIEYYRKIKMALEAGYYIVPPFPINIFAIRTVEKKPTEKSGWIDQKFAETKGISARAVIAGAGEYVSNRVWTRPFRKWVKSAILDELVENTYHTPNTFRSVEFPFKLAKSAVMSETARAMALKVFDQIGIMGGGDTQKPAAAIPDPIVCGQIMPWFHKRQPVTFFIAWWLDTKTL